MTAPLGITWPAAASPVAALPPTPGGPFWWWDFAGVSLLNDNLEDCACCPEGSLIAAGVNDDAGSAENILVVKLTSKGCPSWVTSWNGPDNRRDYAVSVTSDRVFRDPPGKGATGRPVSPLGTVPAHGVHGKGRSA